MRLSVYNAREQTVKKLASSQTVKQHHTLQCGGRLMALSISSAYQVLVRASAGQIVTSLLLM